MLTWSFSDQIHFFLINWKNFYVQPFSSDLGTEKDVPIVDRSLACNYPWTGEFYVLVIRNALYFPSMYHKLILTFIMRALGVTINDAPKIHCEDTIVDDYSFLFDKSDLWILL